MKKINISYVSSNNKLFTKVKLIAVATAYTVLTSCSVMKSPSNNSEHHVDKGVVSSNYTFSEPLDKSTHTEVSIVMSEENIVEPKKNVDNNLIVDTNNSEVYEDDTEIIYIDEKLSEEVIENTDVNTEVANLDIASIELRSDKVSTYNTDFEISSSLQEKINGYINGFGADCSFLAINLKDGMSFGYNIDATYQTASTIKAPFALYSFKEMDKGNGSQEELKVYEVKFRRDGSGVLKNKESGTSYSLKDLFYYTINYSDNVAYYMVHDRFYSENYNTFLKGLGCKQLYLYSGSKWSFIDARSMALIWQEIYKYKDETEYGKHLFDLLTNAEYNYMKEGMEKYNSAHKSGWTPRETHDSGIVFADDDYIVVTLNNNNGNYSAKSQLLNICGCIEEVIDEYTLYKEQNKDKTLVKQ